MGTDSASYASAGLSLSTPLTFLAPDYGNWTFSAGLKEVLRDHQLQQVGPPKDDAGSVVTIGTVSIGFAY